VVRRLARAVEGMLQEGGASGGSANGGMCRCAVVAIEQCSGRERQQCVEYEFVGGKVEESLRRLEIG